ncbi:HAD-IC family P-type ATPase [Candidatus Peregrinibacteria bacterium]|nr:HAD-IC family P-type ATPase [Candidatus Peregrinibacteria bacterium]
MNQNTNEHKIPIEELLKNVKSSPKGLTSGDVSARLKQYGKNVLKVHTGELLLIKFLKQFTNFFALLLITGSGLAFFAENLDPGKGNIFIGWALSGVVILNAIFTFFEQYQSERIMASFQKMLPREVEALRDGKKTLVRAEELVPGDIIFLEEGQKIPADARLLEHNSMKIDHSSLTGESDPQLRKLECTHENILESRNMLFSGCLVQSGNGIGVVYGTGMNTQIGKIVELTKRTNTILSPLQKELQHFIRIISAIAIGLGVIFFFVSILLGQQFIGSIIFAIGIIVANVPEGLLPTVTLCLTIAARRMARKNALIKNLDSVETLGSTTVICTDKTGTLTENNMSLQNICFGGEHCISVDMFDREKIPDEILKVLVLCNNAHYSAEHKTFVGDPTETALLKFVSEFESIENFTKKYPRIHEYPFDSTQKRMISVNKEREKMVAYMKGAPEVVLKKCMKYYNGKGIVPLTDKYSQKILNSYKLMASKGNRVLALAYKESPEENLKEEKFIFLGMVGMIDPPRKEVFEALKKCASAGIKVIMITGDYSLTAEAIGRKIGLIPAGKNVTIIKGEELQRMSESELVKALQKENILFARTNPIQKLQIVKALQKMGHVVTVTGDGVNDAPALKNADMGVAMGKSGTEVAREASDMVLMDDNFATIVSAIQEGRTIFENIKKFVAYILTSNVPEILPFIAFALFQIPLPLTVILILSIDLGTDLLPALGLGVEKAEHDIMQKKPRSKDERLMSKQLFLMSYGIIGMLQAISGFCVFFFILFRGGWKWGQILDANDSLYLTGVTAYFATVIWCQIANVFTCRTRRESIFSGGIFTNKLIIFGIFAEIVLLSIMVYVPFVRPLFGTHSLSFLEISLGIPFAFVIFFGAELRKKLLRNGNKFVEKHFTW